ncbi:MAG TPA: vanadium-dependent haloperoxidase [Dongiaceae bacterium]|nr:vanadium-dependent haloperoxidase [Dongiaceae bacterium]
MKLIRLGLVLACGGDAAAPAWAAQSIARVWDEQILAGIRIDVPNPPVHARNLFHLSVAMYDAWAAYDPVAVGYLFRGKQTAVDLGAARNQAISFAAYRLLKERYSLSRGALTTLPALDAQMVALGYDTNLTSLDTSTPAGVGNAVAAAVSSYFLNDGALQTRAYLDWSPAQGGYASVNPPLETDLPGTPAVDVNRWQPLLITNAVDQTGTPVNSLQKFLGSQWLGVRPFALARTDPTLPWMDPGPPPHLDGVGDTAFRSNVVELIRCSSQLTPDDGVVLDICPGAFGNNTLGENDGAGHPVNPARGLPYAPNWVKRGDFARVLAEFWADGPNSETPPGHWNVIANGVSDDPSFVKRLGGTGPVVDDLEWDVKVYFALNAAVHDAACAAWSLKRYYDGWRPIEAIRYMGQLGQSSDPNGPSYHPDGLPLVTNLIEVVTAVTAQPGGRHAGLPVGAIALFTWPGQPADPTNQYSGVHWIQAVDWLPYQRRSFVTPAFPGYISGHSTFSRAAAEVLAAATGSPFFPGGLGTYTVTNLTFEHGPTQPVQLQWGTYFDAADQAGLSRIWGGIHPPVDDLTGRRSGSPCGQAVWDLARQYFDGTIGQTPAVLTFTTLNAAACTVRCNTLRGFWYQWQFTTDLAQPFTGDPGGFTLATDTSLAITNTLAAPSQFCRIARALAPR